MDSYTNSNPNPKTIQLASIVILVWVTKLAQMIQLL